MDEYPDKLSPYGKQLLRVLGGDPKLAAVTPAVLKRWAVDRPESIVNLCPDEPLVRAALHLPEVYFKKPESELIAEMPYKAVSRSERRLRIHFWEEYEAAAKEQRPMDLDLVAQGTGAVSWTAFRDDLLTSDAKLAWFMIPPAGYRVQLKEAQELGLARLMDILELPATDPRTGKTNVGIALLHIQAWKAIDLRLNGPLVQKIVSLTGDMGSPNAEGDEKASLDMDAVDRRLAELEAVMNGTQLPPQKEVGSPQKEVIDIDVEGG